MIAVVAAVAAAGRAAAVAAVVAAAVAVVAPAVVAAARAGALAAAAAVKVQDVAVAVETVAATGIGTTEIAAPATIPGPAITREAAMARRTSVGTAVVIAIETAIGTGTVIDPDIIGIVMVIAIETAIEIVSGTEIGNIAKPAFTSRRTMAIIDTARTPMNRAIATVCTPGQMMRDAAKATIRSARISTGTALGDSYPFSEARRLTARRIAMVSCEVITKGFRTIRITSSADDFTDRG